MIMVERKNLGLSSEDVKALLSKYGNNEVKAKQINPIIIYLKSFYGPLPLALEVTAVISYIFGDHIETILIFVLVIINSFIALVQRVRTNKSLEELSSKLVISVRVNRDNLWQVIPSTQLVPGDLIRIRTGDIVSADLILLNGSIEVDQSTLTGESLSQAKQKNDLVYSGSIVVRGEATAIVDKTGMSTKYGQLATMIERSHPPTNLEKIVFKIIKYQFIINSFLIILIIIFNFYIKLNLQEFVSITIVLILASIPAAFPTMFIIAQTFGALKMSKLNDHKGVLVRRLTAVQDAASMNVLCLDKTGTLTINHPTVTEIVSYVDIDSKTLSGLIASASNIADNDPIDLALIKYANDQNVSLYNQIDFSPFNIKTKSTIAKVEYNGQVTSITKGLPSALLKQGFLFPDNSKKDQDRFSEYGYRVIAIGIESDKSKKIIGLVGLSDPLKEDAKQLLEELKNLSINVKIITGDNLQTARYIAKQLGLEGKCTTINEIADDPGLIFKNQIFAEAFPHDKLTIIETLQRASFIVGMTGDGVNDAPALAQAEVGIAVNNASDIAKNSASLILSDNGLKDVISAVKISREVDTRVKTWAINKSTKSFQIALLIFFYLFFERFIILTPLLIILVFFANDFVTISIASDNTVLSNIPTKWNINKMIIAASMLGSVFFVILISGLYLIGLKTGLNAAQIRTAVLLLLVFQGQASLYVLRSKPHFWSVKPSRTLITSTLFVSTILIILATSGFIINELPIITICYIVIISLLSLFIGDIIKEKLNIG